MLSKKEKKRLYDKEYRRKNKELIAKKKKAYNETSAGRKMQKRARDKRKDKHLEYCRQEDYRKNKKEYDRIRLAKNKYGEYWESIIICNEIEKLVREIVSDKLERQKMRGVTKRMMAKIAWKRHILYGWNYNY